MVFGGQPDLLIRFREGDIAALETVYWAYVDRVARVVQAGAKSYAAVTDERVRFSSADLGDLVQEVFVRAFLPASRRRYDGRRPYGPYLGQIARNVVVDYWRETRRRVSRDFAPFLEALSLLDDAVDEPPEDWADQGTIAVVETYLASLEPDVRRIHHALYVQGLSHREAASALGLAHQAVRRIEARLREGLRRELRRAGRLHEENPSPRAPGPSVRTAPRDPATKTVGSPE